MEKLSEEILIKQMQIAQKLDKTKTLPKKTVILEKHLTALKSVLR